MSAKLIAAFALVAFALAGGSLGVPGKASAEDGKAAATPSSPDPDHKDKRRKRNYDWSSAYHYYRDRYEPDHERHGDRTGAKPSVKATTKESTKTVRRKGDDTDRGYDWRSAYRRYSDRDWTDRERRDRRKRRQDNTSLDD
jgi:hypothetical protein